MTQHIEEARKTYRNGCNYPPETPVADGTLILAIAAALAAAEERGRIEERERCVAVFDRLLRQLVELDRFSRSYALRLTSLAKADCAAITKEPTL